MTTLDQLIAAAQLRTATTAQLGLPEAETRAHLERLIGADVVALLDECEATPEGIARLAQIVENDRRFLPIALLAPIDLARTPAAELGTLRMVPRQGAWRAIGIARSTQQWPDKTTSSA